MAAGEDALSLGDIICLYSEDVYGYVFSQQSTSATRHTDDRSTHSAIAVRPRDDRTHPDVPDSQTIAFRICPSNRYKHQKAHEKLLARVEEEPNNMKLKSDLASARRSAESEKEDNNSEQIRQRGKRLLYGQVIQLQHIFTDKYVHVSSRCTSETEPSNMMVHLSEKNAKHAHFRVMPRYKVKAEGDLVQVKDQVVLESVKSSGQYLHVSRVTFGQKNTIYSECYEFNLSVRTSGFTLYRRYKPKEEHAAFLKAGQPIRLFHRELEAYLVAEGVFDDKVMENVHLRVRSLDTNNPKTMFPPTSAITYWQVEFMEGAVSGDVVKWEQQIRLKHMCTRLYLCIDATSRELQLTENHIDPSTVFRFHPVLRERDEIEDDTYCRIEHVVTGLWLHGSHDEYRSITQTQVNQQAEYSAMACLKWSRAPLKQITATEEMQYDDAFTIQEVEPQYVSIFNYMAGMVPVIQRLIESFTESTISGKPLNSLRTHRTLTTLLDIKNFMIVNSEPSKVRQKLMRNLKVVELLVKLLQMPIRGRSDSLFMTKIFLEAYNVLHAYLMGDSRKNELYIAKHLDFFKSQISIEGEIGLNAAHMVMELVKDNRKLVDRIPQSYIDDIVDLLNKKKNYRYLELLNVLCVCDGLSISDNQRYITEKWLMSEQKTCVFHTELGQAVGKESNVVFVSTDGKRSWKSLRAFAKEFIQAAEGARNVSQTSGNAARRLLKKKPQRQTDDVKDDFLFLEHQLDLFGKLCQGRNEFCIDVITQRLRYLTWEEAYICLSDAELPSELRAKYCELIINLFVDVDINTSVLDQIKLTFIYDRVPFPDDGSSDEHEDAKLTSKSEETLKHFPQIRDWIENFLDQHKDMTASLVGENNLIEQVLRLLHYLVRFGYYDRMSDIRKLLKPLLSLTDGRNDKPYPRSNGTGGTEEFGKVLEYYQSKDRYRESKETKAIVDAKDQAMKVLDLLFNFRFNTRLQRFISEFKDVHHRGQQLAMVPPDLGPLLYEQYNVMEDVVTNTRAKRKLQEMFLESEYFKDTNMVDIIMDLSRYDYDKMVTGSMWLLQRYFSAHDLLFKRAILAQVLITDNSIQVCEMLNDCMPVMRRLINSKMSDDQIEVMVKILNKLTQVCHLENEPEERHPMNQSILYNCGILRDIFDLISQDIDVQLMGQYRGLKSVFEKSFQLLRLLARGNKLIQRHLFDRIDTLLDSRGAESDLADALTEVFTGNKNTCMKVLPHHIQRIMSLAAQHTNHAPQFLDLLNAIVKVEELDLPLKRNQAYVMTYFMQYRSEIAFPLDFEMADKKRLLQDKSEPPDTLYMMSLVDLLATCAEGENRFIESINQTIFSIEELLNIMNDKDIPNHRKKSFVRFLLWVYLNTAGGMIESGAGDLPHDKAIWQFFEALLPEFERVVQFANNNADTMKRFLKKRPSRSNVTDTELKKTSQEDSQNVHETCHYFLEAVLPLLQVFFRSYYEQDYDEHPREMKIVDRLAREILTLCDAIGPLINNEPHMKTLVNAVSAILASSTLPQKMNAETLEKFQEKYGRLSSSDIRSDARKAYEEYYSLEEELNRQLNVFAVNYSLVYGGSNTVATQLGYPSDEEYTDIGGDEELPLGEEFQHHIGCFLDQQVTGAARYKEAGKLVDQLMISSKYTASNEKLRQEQEMLDIKSLQLLRGMVHNEIVKLSKESEGDTRVQKANRRQMNVIRTVQSSLNSHDAMLRVLPHLSKPSDAIVREVLAFLAVMLFGGNKEVQKSLHNYFIGTREEKFFFAVKNRMNLSSIAFKEQRALIAQHQAKIDEAIQQARDLQRALKLGNVTEDMLQPDNLGSTIFAQIGSARNSKGSIDGLRKRLTGSNVALNNAGSRAGSQMNLANLPQLAIVQNSGQAHIHDRSIEMKPLIDGHRTHRVHPTTLEGDEKDMSAIPEEEENFQELEEYATRAVLSAGEIDFKDDGYIELVLRVLAYICDGQYEPLQDYIREQPDNIKSVNLVSEVCKFLSLTYTSINRKSISLITQIFETLVEFSSGNRFNQIVIYENKICDLINFILRSQNQLAKCGLEWEFRLKLAIGQLITVMIEENVKTTASALAADDSGVDSKKPPLMNVAADMMDALDEESIKNIFVHCYEQIMLDKNNSNRVSEEEFELLESVGFKYFHITCRLMDLDRSHKKITKEKLLKKENESSSSAAWKFYERKTLSVEILKQDELQKVYFLVRDKSVLREEVKQLFKYEVDRSSPSNKLRDFVDWSKEIIDDIKYQRRILSNKVGYFMVRGWWYFNILAIFLSMLIALVVLVSWTENTTTTINPVTNDTVTTYSLVPVRPYWAEILTDILAPMHNIVSVFILVSYFLSNHPTFPTRTGIADWFRSLLGMTLANEEACKVKHLERSFFSFFTFYYLVFFAMSVLGSVFWGYFFAFHLMHIALHNQLLSRVILALTKNGLSLLWVGLYSLVFFYIYALISFAGLRELFLPSQGNFCDTVWGCTITVIHRGLIVGLYDQDYIGIPEDRGFTWHFGKFIFDVSFFILITTIGLNIVFGIIVDTFSELRDSKWNIDNDMRSTCFICSRNSYDFEHHSNGFERHVKDEHHLWAYLFFFIHLDETRPNDYTAIEMFVAELYNKEQLDFFPLNRSLALQHTEEDDSEVILENLMAQVSFLVSKKKDEEQLKMKEQEKARQLEWEQKYRVDQ